MKISVPALLLFVLTAHVSIAQEIQSYTGPYLNGEAEYSYKENEQLQKIYNGPFKYTEKRTIADRGECEVLVSGTFREDLKAGPWAVTIKSADGVSETITGQYLNGQKVGVWTHRLSADNGAKNIKTVSAAFNKNLFKGTFSYAYGPAEDDKLYQSLNVTGLFDADGTFDGEWKVTYTDLAGLQFEDLLKFKHGVLYYRMFREVTTGKVIDHSDNEALVLGFFNNMNATDSSAVVGEKKYGLKRGIPFKHEVLNTVLGAWYDVGNISYGNHAGASIPTMIIEKGETKPAAIKTRQVIDWKDTPKGHKEWLAEQERIRIQQAYDAKVAEADLSVKSKKFEEAITLYREAMLIKNEAYPKDKITEVQELIRLRDRKNELIASVEEKQNQMNTTHSSIIANENLLKKQKHLAEAYQLAYDHALGKLKSDHSRARTHLENKNLDHLTIEDLEAYEKDLAELRAMQDKVNGLIGTETKDLEKELKKLNEQPSETLARLKQ